MARISLLLVGSILWTSLSAGAGVDRWTPTGPPGAFVLSLLIDPQNPDILYASTFSIGPFKSVDRGESWQSLLPSFPDEFHVLTIDPVDPSILYATTPSQLIRSFDRGQTWEPLSSDLPRPPLFVVVAPTDPSVFYAGTFGDGVFRSNDGGVSWTPVNSGLPDLNTQTLAVDPTDASTVYFGSLHLFKSTDAGVSWTDSSSGLPDFVSNLVIDPVDPSTLYILADGQGVFKSTDAGQTWSPTNHGLTDLAISGLTMDPTDSQTLYAAGKETVFRTTQGGSIWTPIGGPTGVSPLNHILYDPRPPATLFLTSASLGNGIVRSTDDGATWQGANRGINGRWLFCVVVAPSDPDTLYVGVTGLGLGAGVSHDGGKTWEVFGQEASPGQPNFAAFQTLAVDPIDLDTAYAGTFKKGVFKTTDGARTWTEINQGITDLEIRSLAVEPTLGTLVLAGTEGGKVFQSLDGGESWNDRSAGLAGGPVFDLLIDAQNPSKIWAATGVGLYASEGGAPWELVLSEAFVAIEGAKLDPNRFYAAKRQREVLRSSDGGTTWSPFPVPDSLLLLDLVVDPSEPDRILAASPVSGMNFSEDGGETWVRRNDGLFSALELRQLAVAATQPATFYTVIGLSTLFALNLAQPPLLTATKTVSGEFFEGGSVVYLLTLTNLGDDEQPDNPGAEMVDVLPTELSDVGVQVLEGGGAVTFDPNSNTVTWNGSIPGHGSVVIRIEATLEGAVFGSPISNQAQVNYDSDGDGTNDATALSNDPESAGATVFVVGAAIPSLGPLGALFLGLLLSLAGLWRLVGADSRGT